MVCKLRYRMRCRVDPWSSRDANPRVLKSYAVVPIMCSAVQLFYFCTSRWGAMKNRNEAHFTVVYNCVSIFVVKYIHRRQKKCFCSRGWGVLLVQSVTKKAVSSSKSSMNQILQPTVTFKLREAFIMWWRRKGVTIKEFHLEQTSTLPFTRIEETFSHSLLLSSLSLYRINVCYHPEIRNCLSIPLTHARPFIIIQLLLSQKQKEEKRSSNPTPTVGTARKKKL